MSKNKKPYLVYGGEIANAEKREFKNPNEIEIVGIFADYEEAFKAWRGAAQRTVDNAEMRFFIVQVDQMQQVSKDPSSD